MKLSHATERLIDSVWTLAYDNLSDGTIYIHTYDRENPIGYEMEDHLMSCRLVEDAERTVTAVTFGTKTAGCFSEIFTVQVANPKHVFDYRKQEETA